ncbi:MAG TPA: hypothetical protein VKU41_12690 [Polyangiaceae bacterium]|nr:hypothetical protein [Polyangiaceae bacterium]
MGKARTGRIALATFALVAAVGVVGVATGRLSLLTHAWGDLSTVASSVASTVASSVAALPSALSAPPEGAADAGAPKVDAPDAAPPHKQAGPLSSAQLGAPLVHGTFVSACGAPDDMKVTVKASVKMGRAVDVKVTTEPPDPSIAACVERAVRDMQWDVTHKTGHVTVRY